MFDYEQIAWKLPFAVINYTFFNHGISAKDFG